MKTTNKLYEDLGSIMRHRPAFNPGVSQQHPQATFSGMTRHTGMSQRFITQKNLQGIELFKFNFHGWQQNVIRSLNRNRNIYVVASPGAGKTAPVAYYWAENIIGINPSMRNPTHQQTMMIVERINNLIQHPETFKKILYLCPIRQLVYSIQKEFKEYLSQILVYAFRFITTTNIGQVRNIMDYISNYNRELSELYRERRSLMREHESFVRLGDSNRMMMIQKRIETLDDEIQKRVADAISKFIDEKLLRIKTATDSFPLNSNPLIVICIYESAEPIYNKLKKDIGIVIMDEAHSLQQISTDQQSRAAQIVKHIYPIIKQTKQNKNQLILLSGTVHPTSATNLCNYINYCLQVKIDILDVNSRNASDISVIPMDDLNYEQTIVKLLTSPKENGNLIAIFGKQKIKRLAQLAVNKMGGGRYTAQQIDRGDLQAAKRKDIGINLKDLDRYQAQFGPDTQVKFGEKTLAKLKENPSIGNIRNDELLTKCLLSGFGYVFRQDEDWMSSSQKSVVGQNMKIVAELFSQGKIHTLMATDAIGVGLNMKIKNMYVPRATKFNGTRDADIPISDASQFYNRVGRMAYLVSSIYTPENCVNSIVNAVSATNRQYEERENIVSMNGAICRSKDTFSIMWTNAMSNQLPETMTI